MALRDSRALRQGQIILCRALRVAVPDNRILPAITSGFAAAVGCYLLPDTPGDILERLLPFSLGMAILLLRRSGHPKSAHPAGGAAPAAPAAPYPGPSASAD